MLVDGRCSIYEHRPRTCRTYDCRVFAATGVEVDSAQVQIGARVRRWQFRFPGPDDLARHDAVRAATRFLREHRADLGDEVPRNPTQLAVVATRLHELFLGERRPDVEHVRRELHEPARRAGRIDPGDPISIDPIPRDGGAAPPGGGAGWRPRAARPDSQ